MKRDDEGSSRETRRQTESEGRGEGGEHLAEEGVHLPDEKNCSLKEERKVGDQLG